MHQDFSTATQRAGRTIMGLFLFLLPLAIYPFSALPTVDIKWLLIGIAGLASATLSGVAPQAGRGLTLLRLPTLALAGMVTWALIGGLWAANRGLVLVESTRLLSYVLLFASASAVFSMPRHVERALICFVSAMAVVSLYGFVQWAGYDPLPWDPSVMDTNEYRHLPSTLGNPNIAGHALVLSIISAVSLAIVRRKWWLLGFAALNVAHLVLTRHRAGIAALIAAAILAIVMVRVSRMTGASRTKAIRALFITVASGALGIVGLLTVHYALYGSVVPSEQSLLLRINSIYGSARMAMENPVFGFGLGNYEIANVPFWTPFEQETFVRAGRYNTHAHNEYANFAAETGFPTALLYMLFLFSVLFRGLGAAMSTANGERRGTGVICAILAFAFAIDSLFGFNFRAPVSGACMAIIAGACEGVLGPQRVSSTAGRRVTWVACVGAGAACAVLGCMTFVSQRELLRAKGAMLWDQPAEALHHIQRGARRAPWNWEFPLALANDQMRRGEWADAIYSYVRAQKLHLYSLGTIMGLARAETVGAGTLWSADRAAAVSRAEGYLREAETLCPALPDIEEVRGNCAMVLAMDSRSESRVALLESARDHFLNAIADGTADRAKLYHLTAITTLELGDAASALEYLIRAVEDPAAREPVMEAFVSLVEQQGKLDVADSVLAAVRTRLARQPNAGTHYRALISSTLGMVRAMGGADAEEVLPLFEESVAAYPLLTRTWEVYYRVAESHGAVDRFKAAFIRAMADIRTTTQSVPVACLAVSRVWIVSPPDTGGALDMLANSLASTDAYRPDTRNAHLAWAAHIVSQSIPGTAAPSLTINAGIVLARTGRHVDALQMFDAVGPNLQPVAAQAVLRERIYSLLALGKAVEAEDLVRSALRIAPGDPDLALALPRILAKQGRLKEAQFEYELLAASVDPNSPLRASIDADLKDLQSLKTP